MVSDVQVMTVKSRKLAKFPHQHTCVSHRKVSRSFRLVYTGIHSGYMHTFHLTSPFFHGHHGLRCLYISSFPFFSISTFHRVLIFFCLMQTERRRLEAFEMWIWRRMEKISWLDKVTNEEALRRVNEDRQILNSLAKETSMDWPCFETRWTFARNYWRQNER